MYLLTLRDKSDDGAYAVADDFGEKVLFLFEQEDDAVRYAMMMREITEQEDSPMDVIEVDGELAIMTCTLYNYKYAVITPNDFVIPPKDDNISKD